MAIRPITKKLHRFLRCVHGDPIQILAPAFLWRYGPIIAIAGQPRPCVDVTPPTSSLLPHPAMHVASHPRVFLDVDATGEAMCPYCGTRYRLRGGPARQGH